MDATLVLTIILVGFSAVLGWLVGRRRTRRAVAMQPPATTDLEPTDPPDLAWIARANAALGAWLRYNERGLPTATTLQPGLSSQVIATVESRIPGLRTPRAAGRTGVERLEEGNLVFVATDDLQVALLLPPGVPHTRAISDLEHLVASLRTRSAFEAAVSRSPSAGETVESISIRLALEVERLFDAEAAVVVGRARGAQVVGTALRADPHLHRVTASPGSPVDLVVRGELTQAVSAYEPLGILPWDRRHRERRAYVMPIAGAGGPLGALVVWSSGGAEPTGPARAELEKAIHRTGLLLEDAVHRLELTEQATRDPLTGLANRRGLENAMAMVKVESGTVICLDLDHFKTLNDSLGHPAGDAALGFVSRVIQDTIRDRDTAARIGGEEFAVWLPATKLEEATKVAERLRTRLAGRAWGWRGQPWPITASFGVAAWPESTGSRDNLIPLADQALYEAKDRGRNRVEVVETS